MDAILSTATLVLLIILTGLPFIWPYRTHRAILVSFAVGVALSWAIGFVTILLSLFIQSVFYQDVILDLIPTYFIGFVVSVIATVVIDTARYLVLFIIAHFLLDKPRLIPSLGAALAVGYWLMSLITSASGGFDISAASFAGDVSLYLNAIFGVVAFVLVGLALSRSLTAGFFTMALLIVLKIIRHDSQFLLPGRDLFDYLWLGVNLVIVLGLFVLALFLIDRHKNGPTTTAGP